MILDFQVIVILFLDTESNKRAECYIPSLPSAPPTTGWWSVLGIRAETQQEETQGEQNLGGGQIIFFYHS